MDRNKLDLFFDADKLKDVSVQPNLIWDCVVDGVSMSEDEIVKVKKSDLEKLISANTEAYNLLDECSASASDVEEKVKKAFRTLEDAPAEASDIIIEEEDEEKV